MGKPKRGTWQRGHNDRKVRYDISFKQRMVMYYLTGNQSTYQLGKLFNVHPCNITTWTEKYYLELVETNFAFMTEQEQQDFDQLLKQNKVLKNKLEYEQMKSFALQTMIDLAKEKLGVDVRKNSGAQTAGRVKQYYPQTGMDLICGLFGKTRQAWYIEHGSQDEDTLSDAIIIRRVKEIRQHMPRIGTRKLHYLLTETLQKHDINIGRDKLFDLLERYGLLITRRKRHYIRTTNSNHWFRRYSNLIRELEVMRPNHLWVSDITYISLTDRFCYLSLVTDAYPRKIVGYCLYQTLKKEGPLQALSMALGSLPPKPDEPLIHHSDRGLQYCCGEYTRRLNRKGISISMTENGDPYENAIAERVNGIFKTEFLLDQDFESFELAQAAVKNTINTYNKLRPHSSCNYLTPEQAHQQQGLLPYKWKRKKKEAINVL